MANNEVVLDASAILAIINQEPGAEVVLSVLDHAIINTVTLAEVITKLADWGMSENAVQDTLTELGIRAIPFDESQAYRAGMMRPTTRRFGLSLGDRACLALGQISDSPVMTGTCLARNSTEPGNTTNPMIRFVNIYPRSSQCPTTMIISHSRLRMNWQG